MIKHIFIFMGGASFSLATIAFGIGGEMASRGFSSLLLSCVFILIAFVITTEDRFKNK